jgi:DNA-binding transcriptional ArsR family regulator
MSTEPQDRIHVRDAASMRALAHPARLKAISHLSAIGPATATELGDVAGLTPSAMSYHLRALERAGLISTAPSRGDGRERVWQSNFADGWTIESFEDGSADTRAASVELMETVLAMQDVEVRQWLGRADEPGWLDTGFFVNTVIVATQEELVEIGQRIAEVLAPYHSRRREDPPADAVKMRASFRGFPGEDVLPY